MTEWTVAICRMCADELVRPNLSGEFGDFISLDNAFESAAMSFAVD